MVALSYWRPWRLLGRAADGSVELLGDKEGIRGPNRLSRADVLGRDDSADSLHDWIVWPGWSNGLDNGGVQDRESDALDFLLWVAFGQCLQGLDQGDDEERHYDVGLDDNDGFDWSEPDR